MLFSILCKGIIHAAAYKSFADICDNVYRENAFAVYDHKFQKSFAIYDNLYRQKAFVCI